MTAPTFTLNDGLQLPQIGLGTYKLRGQQAVSAVANALAMGYRLLDSAFNYDNEAAVGAGVRKSGVPSDEVIVTTKLPGRYHAYDLAVAAVEESALRLGLDCVDLVLIHWPNPGRDQYVQAWEALLACKERGLIRSVGVSNFLPEHVERIVAATGVTPSVNQIERHPFFPQVDHVAWDAAHGIRNEAWSPLLRGAAAEDPVIAQIAAAHGKTGAQVVLRWQTQTGVVPIPKAATAERQAANLDIFDFELSSAELAAITALAKPDQRLILAGPNEHEEL
ncbi:MAG: aldo/keto reductase [Propionibacteriaceae bacterium]|jgi:diketogulonate reductase-like aldo/keto reductase|nr:aldo/keto reductase [Propionibacteriaceae bacterium]